MRALCLLLLGAAAFAGDERAVADLLASAEPRDQAWGAYRAVSERAPGQVPALRRLLVAHRGKDTEESRLVRETVLDSLIRLKARVPWKDLKGFAPRERTRVLILLAQRPDDHLDGLRAVLDDRLPVLEWLLVCNVLAARKAPGFAAYLLSGLEMTLEIKVYDPRPNLRFQFGGRAMGGRSDGRLVAREGWPPRTHYALSRHEGDDRVLVADGSTPVYYRRTEVAKGVRGIGGSYVGLDRDTQRIAYLAELMGTPAKTLGLRPRSFAIVAWRDEAHYLKEASRAHERIYRAWNGVVESLCELELLTEEEALGLQPDLATIVEDLREQKQPPLPRLPG